ncbi:MAG: ABC transporter permease [Planctomycetales bacterium]|nr:ABC transporter permease [Planctomycetales bacterium]
MEARETIVKLLNQSSLILFAFVFLTFGILADSFLTLQNVRNILIQSSSLGIAATGMTLVLLTAGVDLSLGSIMFVAVAVSGKLLFNDYSLAISIFAALAVGFLLGMLNGLMIVRFRIVAFIATLAMLFAARGFGLWFTNTRAMNMPDEVTQLGATHLLGVPVPILALVGIAGLTQAFLAFTPWGRQLYALGVDPNAARKAGIRVDLILWTVYSVCGGCAAMGGLVALSQTGAVSPSFGSQREFAAIAAAVLGGTSLFGGRGTVFPGTILGAILFQTIENGLVIMNADPYLYPMVVSIIIFLAVLLDTVRNSVVNQLRRRHIRVQLDASQD